MYDNLGIRGSQFFAEEAPVTAQSSLEKSVGENEETKLRTSIDNILQSMFSIYATGEQTRSV